MNEWQDNRRPVQTISLAKELICSSSYMLLQNCCVIFNVQVWKEREKKREGGANSSTKLSCLTLLFYIQNLEVLLYLLHRTKMICREQQEFSKLCVSSSNFLWTFGSIFSIGLQYGAVSSKLPIEEEARQVQLLKCSLQVIFLLVLASSFTTNNSKDVNTS